MSQPTETTSKSADPADDCSLPTAVQSRNIVCYAGYWSVFYLVAPVSYIGLTHANLLKQLGNSDTVNNLPSAVYQWLTIVPVVVTWFFPRPRHLKPLAILAIGAMAAATLAVALTLASGAQASTTTKVVIAHGAVFGAANGVLFAGLWDFLRQGVATSRRGRALGFAFGIGPLFACIGALLQDALFQGQLLRGRSFGLEFPDNYIALFAGAVPLLLFAAAFVVLFRVPLESEAVTRDESPLRGIVSGAKQFMASRNVWLAVALYLVVYSGGNAILSNLSLHAKEVIGGNAETLGIQTFLRFGFKAAAGGLLGWLLSRTNPRATLLATTSVLLAGMTWALTSTGWWFMLTFGVMGAGELFGAYFPNYITTASAKPFVRINVAYMSLLSATVGFSALAFGMISDAWGRIASFYAAAGVLGVAIVLILLLLPANPAPKE